MSEANNDNSTRNDVQDKVSQSENSKDSSAAFLKELLSSSNIDRISNTNKPTSAIPGLELFDKTKENSASPKPSAGDCLPQIVNGVTPSKLNNDQSPRPSAGDIQSLINNSSSPSKPNNDQSPRSSAREIQSLINNSSSPLNPNSDQSSRPSARDMLSLINNSSSPLNPNSDQALRPSAGDIQSLINNSSSPLNQNNDQSPKPSVGDQSSLNGSGQSQRAQDIPAPIKPGSGNDMPVETPTPNTGKQNWKDTDWINQGVPVDRTPISDRKGVLTEAGLDKLSKEIAAKLGDGRWNFGSPEEKAKFLEQMKDAQDSGQLKLLVAKINEELARNNSKVNLDLKIMPRQNIGLPELSPFTSWNDVSIGLRADDGDVVDKVGFSTEKVYHPGIKLGR